MSNASETNLKHSNGFYGKIETLGNKIPDPMIFFLWFSVIVLVASWIFSALGASAINPATGETVVVYNLITRDGIIKIFSRSCAYLYVRCKHLRKIRSVSRCVAKNC